MNVLIDFLINNYIWFLVISLILIFALIGYLVDMTSPNRAKKKEITPITPDPDQEIRVHPAVEVYTNEVFDEPLINEKNTN